MLRGYEQELMEVLRITYPMVTKEDALDRQLVGGTKVQRIAYKIYYHLTLASYDIVETFMWLILGAYFYSKALYHCSKRPGMRFVMDGVDFEFGGIRQYEFGPMVWVQLRIIEILTYKIGWYKLICHKI
ncbi:MAG: hypothetical protein KF802_02610 [Bdellovibrionaceae bacterium]|nr:hypothetical protein [Pseudobdellovibrionaceae bacterium]